MREAEALAACTESPVGATAYVTLEPCCHTGKKTPPCVPRLIEAKIGRVVVACVDPNPQVSGKGLEELRVAGLEVDVGVLAARGETAQRPVLRVGYAPTSLRDAEVGADCRWESRRAARWETAGDQQLGVVVGRSSAPGEV